MPTVLAACSRTDTHFIVLQESSCPIQSRIMSHQTIKVMHSWDGVWRGQGTNHERQTFNAELVARTLFGGKSTLVWFSARGLDGTIYHEEVALLGATMGPDLHMTSANSNLPFVQQFSTIAHASESSKNEVIFHFGNVVAGDTFRETVAFEAIDPQAIKVTFSWGLPGEDFAERSSVMLSPATRELPPECPLR